MDIVPSRYPVRSRGQSKSTGQFNLGRQIKNLYGPATILEEFPIPDSRMSLDFYMPQHGLAFEFQGTQHDAYIEHFHGNKDGFERQKIRDQQKREWCELNDIILIEVRDANLSAEELKELIRSERDD